MLKKYIPPQQQQLGPLLDLTAIAAVKRMPMNLQRGTRRSNTITEDEQGKTKKLPFPVYTFFHLSVVVVVGRVSLFLAIVAAGCFFLSFLPAFIGPLKAKGAYKTGKKLTFFLFLFELAEAGLRHLW